MRGRVFFRYSLLALVAVPISFLWLFPQVIRCMRVSYSSDFRLLDKTGNVYSSRTATAKQQAELREHTQTARQRIRRFWGDKQGQAILIYSPNQDEYETYCAGGEGAGCSIGTPWGTSYLVLGPEGNNADVIAHELCHDELFARLGWWRVKREIPQWFNEGLALMVDYRFSNPSVWEQPDSLTSMESFADEATLEPFSHYPMLKLADLESTREFFGGNSIHTMLAYETAAAEVARWLAVVGRAGVPTLTNAIKAGNGFRQTYQQLERNKRERAMKARKRPGN
ncbi:hypothetical protein [Spirosoma linguale]|uniref:Peptidase MA-like domain-containing protein n=1 Tax=Spirosoma linguale (strain ATCC 33905 / DSM 74 / LMG 10896 / Claus 1) TaxID=504472 RepID=D2QGA7_SPILD|nr:hypothetical protein Slin_0651 [Spirosoma linguale DSM 74]